MSSLSFLILIICIFSLFSLAWLAVFFFFIFASFLEEPDFVLEEQNQKILLIFCIDFLFFEAFVLIMMCH